MLKTSFIILFFFIFGCAVGIIKLRLQDKTLLIDTKTDDLIYPTFIEKCKYPDRRIFRYCKTIRDIERYDLDDPKIRELLIASGFQCQSTQRFKY